MGFKEINRKIMRKPGANKFMKIDYDIFLLRSEAVMFKVRPQVISPPKPAAFPTSVQSCRKKTHAVNPS